MDDLGVLTELSRTGGVNGQELIDACRDLMGVADIILWYRHGEYLTTTLMTESAEMYFSSADVRVGTGISGTVAERREPIVVPDLLDEAALAKRGLKLGHRDVVLRLGWRGAVFTPIQIPHLAGVLAAYSRVPGGVDVSTLRALDLVADRLMLRLTVDKLNDRAARLSRLGEVLNAQVHDLRQLSTTTLIALEQLRDHPALPSELEARVQEAIDPCRKIAGELHRELRDVIEQGPRKKRVNISAVVVRAISAVESEARSARISISRDILPRVQILGVEPDLYRAVVNLLKNAITNLADMTHKRGKQIAVELVADHRSVTLTLSDNGTGIQPEHLGHIFDFGVTFSGRGYGIGLTQVEGAVIYSGGSIDVDTEFGHGTEFIMRWPRPRAGRRGRS